MYFANKQKKTSDTLLVIPTDQNKQFFSSMEHVPLGLATFSPVVSHLDSQTQKD